MERWATQPGEGSTWPPRARRHEAPSLPGSSAAADAQAPPRLASAAASILLRPACLRLRAWAPPLHRPSPPSVPPPPLLDAATAPPPGVAPLPPLPGAASASMQAPSLPLLSPRSATVAGTDMGGVEAEARIWEAAASRPAGLLSVAECAFHPHHQHHRWIEPGKRSVLRLV